MAGPRVRLAVISVLAAGLNDRAPGLARRPGAFFANLRGNLGDEACTGLVFTILGFLPYPDCLYGDNEEEGDGEGFYSGLIDFDSG